ncbi:MAG: DMT family transporter [Albidovulum sp.]|nr:DMT family transporter [Albidovulum sp.]
MRIYRSTPRENTSGEVFRGIVAILVEVVLFVSSAGVAKFLSDEVSVSVFLFSRFLFSIPLLLAFAAIQRGKKLFNVVDSGTLALRSVFGVLGITTWLLAVSAIEITIATALAQTLVVFVTILAPILLGERIGIRRWLAVLLGLIGALVLIDPRGSGWFEIGILYAIAAPFFAAVMFILLRKLGSTDEPVTTSTYYNVFGFVVFAGWCALSDQNWPSRHETWILLIGCGIAASLQQFLIAYGHKLAPASLLAPFQYFAVPISIFIGIAFFDESITLKFVVGTSIIVASTYYILVRERRAKSRFRP